MVKNKNEMRIDKKELTLRAMGISNWCYDPNAKERYSIQFYDYDGELYQDILEIIMGIFPYDCLMYQTKHGTHFISFALTYGLRLTKARTLETSKKLKDQDYWIEQKDLTLRISPKWKLRKFRRKRKIISPKPEFKGFIKCPENYRISNKHLEFYYKYMNLPTWVYDKYQDCKKKDLNIKLYHYKTKD